MEKIRDEDEPSIVMELEISPSEKVLGEIDLDKFVDIMCKTKMKNFNRAIFQSLKIIKNETSMKIPYIVNVLAAELDWNAIITSLEWKKEGENLTFRMCPVKFRNKVEYSRYQKTGDYTKVVLKESRKSGEDLIIINSFNPSAEHNIDTWIGKTTFPYPESEWESTIIK